ncbi:hypothetical protein FHR81_001919 [Actinoalloteichus hoggarensis]|uniref:Uncharacterized protein n=1 Tax=Actinoalloteichus hoggarensis TaxID=1470176 RepID=A0A221W4X3_9PSEU|nr:DUF5987 family protein [Actinoalloteichus hoggarensis]ASO20950.1 hypothetical protein AHOG_16620 [Actinoalloteichus hoggarensis]MBB5920881.1 hypothetical protein [Actinoalloteichus hoggarensis]
MTSDQPTLDRITTTTLEAFADTIVPGEKRAPDDHAVAGVAEGGGAVASGALALLNDPASGFGPALASLAGLLNEHADRFAAERGVALDETLPAFVALSYADRAALMLRLTAVDNGERDGWVALAMLSNMAFDTAAHLHTADAFAQGHPGLSILGFARPEADGLWRFRDHSYGGTPAATHPDTSPSGSPA